jgi:hypothetical protein
MINGELKGGHLLWYDETFSEEKTIYDKINVTNIYFILNIQLLFSCIIFGCWFVTICILCKNSILEKMEYLMQLLLLVLFSLVK